MRIASALLLLALTTSSVVAQTDVMVMRDDVPIEAYLTLIAQVSPTARQGADAYMSAFVSRCGRTMRTVELRRAFAVGNGDPTLMAIIRATHEKDGLAVQRLGSNITCPRN
jgi:hypothetical protein